MCSMPGLCLGGHGIKSYSSQNYFIASNVNMLKIVINIAIFFLGWTFYLSTDSILSFAMLPCL
jgi:hypothetical protein